MTYGDSKLMYIISKDKIKKAAKPAAWRYRRRRGASAGMALRPPGFHIFCKI